MVSPPGPAHPSLRAVCVGLPAARHSARLARQAVRRTLATWQLEELTESAELVVTEIVTNAVRHAIAAEAGIGLHLETSGTLLRIEVHDADPRPPVPRVPAEFDVSGFGFVIVEALTDRWGSRRAGNGKAVWAELRIDRQQAGRP